MCRKRRRRGCNTPQKTLSTPDETLHSRPSGNHQNRKAERPCRPLYSTEARPIRDRKNGADRPGSVRYPSSGTATESDVASSIGLTCFQRRLTPGRGAPDCCTGIKKRVSWSAEKCLRLSGKRCFSVQADRYLYRIFREIWRDAMPDAASPCLPGDGRTSDSGEVSYFEGARSL